MVQSDLQSAGGGEVVDEQKARSRVEAYIAPVYENPLNDDRRLSARGACAAIGMSFNTLKKYGLERRLEAAEAYRATKREAAGVGSGSASDKLIKRLRAERDEWKRKYEEMAESYIHLQYAIQREPRIDAEQFLRRIAEKKMPKAVRNAPGVGKRKRRRRGGL